MQPYKILYLVGIDQAGNQNLITFRYREVNSIPILQFVWRRFTFDIGVQTEYSDVQVEHSARYIQGGIPTAFGYSREHPKFIFNRETMELKFDFDDLPSSCVIMQDTAVPFVQLIARM